MHAACKYA